MKLLILILCIWMLPLPGLALEIEAPELPQQYRERMPSDTGSLYEGLKELISRALENLGPDIREAKQIGVRILVAVLLVSLVQTVSALSQSAAETAGVAAVSAALLQNTGTMVALASDTVRQMGSYGKLLLPVMTSALAAQGGVTSAGVLYAGTAFFVSLLQSALNTFLVPGIYLYLAIGLGNAVTGENLLNRAGTSLKQFLSWCLKLLLIVFTSYLSLTRVISGTTDAAALKAAKVSMSTFVPVVGGILADASESVLVSVGILKNAAGIYGILAVLALFLQPFLRIGLQYLVLKLTGGLCAVFGSGRICGVIDCFCTAMGLLLGMTGACCVMVMISTVCFMKGVT